ncbi:MAG TPA: hypothetical protein VLH40_01025 [Atribacteraceae bacterium]|nr:hypothetical protein [Atribacteraceae bacterium]
MTRMHLADSFQTPFTMLGQAPVILIPSLLASIIGLVLSLGFRGLFLTGWGWPVIVASLIGSLVNLFAIGWTTYLIQDLRVGNKPNLSYGWAALSRQISNLWVTYLIVAVVISIGTLFFIVPGLFLAALFLMTVPEAAVTGHTFDRSLRFSFRFLFNEGNFLAVFLLVLVGFILTLVPLIGFFVGNLFYSIWIPYAFLKYGAS